MKKILCVALALLLAAAVTAASAATLWYCPYCGHRNDNNYCPVCGTKRPSDIGPGQEEEAGGETEGIGPGDIGTEIPGTGLVQVQHGNLGPYTQYAYQPAILKQRLATRTGPGTQYDEAGSYFQQGTLVTVLSKAYDSRNGIWWVQVEFTYNGAPMRAYTGVKRFESLNLATVPEDTILGNAIINARTQGYYGPSSAYREIDKFVPKGSDCVMYGYATDGLTGYVQIEFYDNDLQKHRRAWVPESAVTVTTPVRN